MKAIEYAKKYNVPVVLTLGTKFVIAENPQWWQQFLKDHVSILAMNEDEAEALTGEAIRCWHLTRRWTGRSGAVHRRANRLVYGGLYRRRSET